jgi:Tol biopolymer transport system component
MGVSRRQIADNGGQPMDPDRFRRLDDLLQSALPLSPAHREAFLQKVRADDPVIERKLRALLESEPQAAAFLERPAFEGLAPTQSLIGRQVSHYRIVERIGQGGMSEVYRARDTKLRRDVALKILPDRVATDSSRLARFRREAELLARLNHPHIAQIYGLEETDGIHALVMELIEGPTLADRLASGPLPVEQARSVASQMAGALETAHEQGIVHRDLKPANVKVCPDGSVKILDFGLAKALLPNSPGQTGSPSGSLAQSPTVTSDLSEVGLILGTAAYMAPEQASGKAVDKRADIWSFGVVLWEMLAGRRLFPGDDVPNILARVLRAPIDLSVIPAGPLRHLVTRCLDRDVTTRLRDIGEARIVLAQPAAVGVEESRASGPWGWAWATTVVCAVVAAAVGVVYLRQPPSVQRPMAMQVTAPVGTIDLQFALSPDGRLLAITGLNATGRHLWLRSLDADRPEPVPGGEGATYPFWSPDSRHVGFFADGKLKKLPVSGGPPQVVCEAGFGRGGTWSRDDTILFSSNDGNGFAIRRIAADGGAPVVELKPERGLARFPTFLPDGRQFLFVITRAAAEENGIYVGALGSTERRRVLTDESSVVYAAGRLLFIRASALMAQAYDPDSGALTGDPVQVAAGVSTTSNVAYAPVTAVGDDVLIYQVGGDPSVATQFTWYDRTGSPTPLRLAGANFEPVLSPDGKSLAFTRLSRSGSDIWIWDLVRSTEQRLTLDAEFEMTPAWSPHGDRVVFGSNRDSGIFNLFRRDLSGTAGDSVVFRSPLSKVPLQWTRDGKWMVYMVLTPDENTDVWLLPLDNDQPRPPRAVLNSDFSETHPQVSPDGHWITYTSNESGQNEVYLREFPSAANPRKLSTAGGGDARWRGDSREIFYLAADGKMMAVSLKTEGGPAGSLMAGAPQVLFSPPPPGRYILHSLPYDVTPDGRRFLFAASTNSDAVPTLNVSVNWVQARR